MKRMLYGPPVRAVAVGAAEAVPLKTTFPNVAAIALAPIVFSAFLRPISTPPCLASSMSERSFLWPKSQRWLARSLADANYCGRYPRCWSGIIGSTIDGSAAPRHLDPVAVNATIQFAAQRKGYSRA